MGETIELTAADGHRLSAYRAVPQSEAVGAVVIVQEIFGLTAHIRRVTDRYARAGYFAIAPAMFDRLEPDLVFDYTDIENGRAHMRRLEWPDTLRDVDAASAAARGAGARRIAVVGYCWGGTVAHVAACELDIDAAVSYYGAAVVQFLDRPLDCPVMYHFGDQDRSIPAENVEKLRRAYPESDISIHVYEGADHGFNCEDRASFNGPAAQLAEERTLAFLRARLAE